MEKNTSVPILVPIEQEDFWDKIREIVREEFKSVEKQKPLNEAYKTPGLVYKPLYKITEVCNIFSVTRPTIYDWIKHGKLKPYKVRSRLYFLWNDIQILLHE